MNGLKDDDEARGKRRRSQPLQVWIWLIIFGAVAWGVLRTCTGMVANIQSPQAPMPNSHRVTYRVLPTKGYDGLVADLTYENATGDTEQLGNVGLPWSKNMDVASETFLYISAQNQWEFGGVSCEIWVDGIKIKEANSKGAYVIASCSGSLP
jgi:hypothetical protein